MEQARRVVPPCEPVSAQGVRYERLKAAVGQGHPANGCVVAACDEATGLQLWTVAVYAVDFDDEERDAQEIWITRLHVDPEERVLGVVDERRRVWSVDLDTRAVARLPDLPLRPWRP